MTDDLSRFAKAAAVTNYSNDQLTRLVVDSLNRYAAQLRFNLSPEEDTDSDVDDLLTDVTVDGHVLRFKLFLVPCEQDVTAVVLQSAKEGTAVFVAFENLFDYPTTQASVREYSAAWAPAPRVVGFESTDITDVRDYRDEFYRLPYSGKLALFGL